MPALTGAQLQALGQLIMDLNPYLREVVEKTVAAPDTRRVTLRNINMTLDTDEANSGGPTQWTFNGSQYGVRGGLRISYCYEDEFENMVEEHLLIGYEGGYTG